MPHHLPKHTLLIKSQFNFPSTESSHVITWRMVPRTAATASFPRKKDVSIPSSIPGFSQLVSFFFFFLSGNPLLSQFLSFLSQKQGQKEEAELLSVHVGGAEPPGWRGAGLHPHGDGTSNSTLLFGPGAAPAPGEKSPATVKLHFLPAGTG